MPKNESQFVIRDSGEIYTPKKEAEERRKQAMQFEIKDSGERKNFASGMMRDTDGDKIEYDRAFDGPMFLRWAEHLTKGAKKYPDVKPGVPNWTLAAGDEEQARFKKSAIRHFFQWLDGQMDEDHAAAVFFNINGYEYVKEKHANQNGGS